MTQTLGRAWRNLPSILAFALLAFQVTVPWTVANFVTQDGPSHLYAATVAKDLVLHHRNSIYAPWYTIQRTLLPNATATFLLAVSEWAVGPVHAEQLLASLAILLGFLGFCYASRALSPQLSPWTPVANLLFQTWFLWIGFYNFYLGMALVAFPVGFYIRHGGSLTLRRVAALAAGLVFLFFTHIIPAAIAILTLLAVALWIHVAVPIAFAPRTRGRFLPFSIHWRELGVGLAPVLPALILIAIYFSSGGPVHLVSSMAWAWNEFPMHVFATGGGRAGMQAMLSSFLLFYIAAAMLVMKRDEWLSARGGLVIATLLLFLIYLLAPDAGLNGSVVKIRFSWAVFVVGGLLACSVAALRTLRIAVAVWIACFLTGNVVNSMQYARRVSNLAADCLSVANLIPAKSTFVRLRYPTPHAAAKFGYEGIGREPLYHIAGLAAARRGLADLSDYEPASKIFPVVFKKTINPDWQSSLWAMEGPDAAGVESLAWVIRSLPAPIDYVLVIGDENSPEAAHAGMPRMLDYLDSHMRLVTLSADRLFRLYRRLS